MKTTIKRIKRILNKDRTISIIGIASVFLLVFLIITSGIIRALLFTGIIDAIALGILYIKRKKMPKSKRKDLYKKLLLGGLGVGIVGLVTVLVFIFYIVLTAPKFNPANMERTEASVLYDKEGTIIAKLGLEKREKITYNEMPDVLVDAIVATEDSRFFQHNGFDLPRFLKASFGQILGQDVGGASTLTMQVSKNNYTSTIASGWEGIKRKFTDIYIAIFQIERNYTKQEILEFYVNQPYLGSGSYGVEQACQTYFGKSAKDINLTEAALIAGLFQAPGKYDPFLDPKETTDRRATVLYLMERHGYITKEEREIANAVTVESLLTTKNTTMKYQSFIDTVVEEVIEKTGKDPYVTAMDIYTTMDPVRQTYLDNVMSGALFKWENNVVDAGVTVIDVKTGALAAIGAGRHRTVQRSYNNATMINRQIGSTAKPIYDFGTGIEFSGFSTYTLFVDEPYSYSNGEKMGNWDNKYQGLLTTRLALSRSRNITALKAFQSNQQADIIAFSTGLGLSPEVSNGFIHEAHALGGYNGQSPLDMAAAYAAFGSGGYYSKPYSFTKIIYRQTGDVYENKVNRVRAMSEETAYMIADILVDAGSAYHKAVGSKVAMKTGTTNFNAATLKQYKLPSNAINDYWVDGFSTEFAVSVWYGYSKISSEHYSTQANRQHLRLFETVGRGVFSPTTTFVKPAGVIEVAIEEGTNPAMLPSKNTPSDMIITELFRKGTEPTEVSKRFDTLANPTEFNVTLSGSNATLSWAAIPTPEPLDPTYLNTYFTTLYKNDGYRSSAYSARTTWNANYIGDVGYNVYKKNIDGTLTFLGFTKNTYYAHNITGTTTFVIKATYTIFTASESTGVEKSISFEAESDGIAAVLNGGSTVTKESVVAFQAWDPGVTVFENGVDVTEDPATHIVTTITSAELPKTYTVNYSISYKSYSRTLSRTLTIE